MVNTIKSLTDTQAWEKAHLLTLKIYKLTTNFPKKENYGIVSQLRRASFSISLKLNMMS
jgi:four helix bundle protein